ncbi:hypothetical protein GRZ55_10695 [Chelativorans sp. ZYF759]|uniref:hypothetical protein n=1 Tax=Chelativorans sp. ZYF759 TaxID=2692213 RepID=UPI00145E4E02|nr:hypothetical protein [Chelativorans sp. ZYF759]NMG39710.1 hypothetical protein [Chelativorans sp. ZYF759]
MVHAPGSLFDKRLLATMQRGSFVADAITEPLQTRLLADAAALGLAIIGGRAMTGGQFELLGRFLGVFNDPRDPQQDIASRWAT